ncbi:MAG: MMPL family transporter [Lachnospiraceae bacterium]|nr:MMPL family transporter [Candidatus Merdinaster equi]
MEEYVDEACGTKEKKGGDSFMVKLSTFIVDKRNLFFLAYILLSIFCIFSKDWVNVENSLSAYLPQTSETRVGLDLMEEEFITYGSAKFMITNIDYEKAKQFADIIENRSDVSMLTFDDTDSHYNNFSALFDVTFAYPEEDDACLESLESLKEMFKDYDYYVSTTLGDQSSETIATEMESIVVWVAIIVVTVLLITSQTWAEVPVLLITFVSSALLSMGTNFMFGTISFVSDSVTIVLQLALSIDYAIILCNRYKEEHEHLPVRESVITALSKAIIEIASSSLTTIGGLIAMLFMQFGIGPDMAICLIKAILLSLLSVFLLMPGLLMIFGKAMDKTRHKSFIPKIPFVGKFANATRFVVPFLFIGVLVVAYIIQSNCPFVYGYSTIETPLKNKYQIADEMIEESFGKSNMLAIIVPSESYEKEAQLIKELESMDEVDYCVGLANTEAMDGYMLTDRLSARDFAELMDLDFEIAQLLYTAYAVNDENYAKIVSGISTYEVPLIDMLSFLYEEAEEGYIPLEDDVMDTLEDAYHKMSMGRDQLQGENCSRILMYLTIPQEGDETFAFLDELHEIAGKYFTTGAEGIILAGESTSQYDLCKTFTRDNIVVTIVSMLAVLIVLLFTFKSAGMPVLLIMVIEGAIWCNFAYPAIANRNLFFMGYLIVSSIQMGANIDYAIVISGRFLELKDKMPKKKAIIETMNFAFPTIITSGSMLAIAGVLIGSMTSEACIAGIGECIGRGTLISIVIVMFILPQILLLGEKIIDKTGFVMSVPALSQKGVGNVRVDGFMTGQIHGRFVGEIHGVITGAVNATVEIGTMKNVDKPADEEKEKYQVPGPDPALNLSTMNENAKEGDEDEDI